MIKVSKLQDGDGHWYWIPESIASRFNDRLSVIIGIDYMDNPDAFDDFNDKYEKYRTLGDPYIMPEYFKDSDNNSDIVS